MEDRGSAAVWTLLSTSRHDVGLGSEGCEGCGSAKEAGVLRVPSMLLRRSRAMARSSCADGAEPVECSPKEDALELHSGSGEGSALYIRLARRGVRPLSSDDRGSRTAATHPEVLARRCACCSKRETGQVHDMSAALNND